MPEREWWKNGGETKVDGVAGAGGRGGKWVLRVAPVYLTRVLTRIVRRGWCIWVTLTPQSVFQSPSNALHCGVFNGYCGAGSRWSSTGHFLSPWPGGNGEEDDGKQRRRRSGTNTLLPSRIRGRGSWKFLSEREQRVVEMKGVARWDDL